MTQVQKGQDGVCPSAGDAIGHNLSTWQLVFREKARAVNEKKDITMMEPKRYGSDLATLLWHLELDHPIPAKIIELRAVEDLTIGQIAKTLNMMPSAVKTYLNEGKEWLRWFLVDEVDIEEEDVPGLRIYRRAINAADRERYVRSISHQASWHPDSSRSRWWLLYQYVYGKDILLRTADESLPPPFVELAQLAYEKNWMSSLAKQATVQKYVVGSFIGPHVDSRKCFPGEIVTICLVSSARMRLTDMWTPRKFETTLQPGDVVVLHGDARDVWKHEILKCKPSENDDAASWYRLSITLRNINQERVRP